MNPILYVEPNTDAREATRECLSVFGMEVVTAGSIVEFYQKLSVIEPSVCLVDYALGSKEIIELIHFIRAQKPNMGIVVTTARAHRNDRVRSYQAGADLCFSKPVDCEELSAALQGLMSRNQAGCMVSTTPTSATLNTRKLWELDLQNWALQIPNGSAVRLTARELEFLKFFLEKTGTTLKRSKLLKGLGYSDDSQSSRSLDALAGRLRRKVVNASGLELPLKTLHATGYTFTQDLIGIH
jgi:two-component system OmpR family response regulator